MPRKNMKNLSSIKSYDKMRLRQAISDQTYKQSESLNHQVSGGKLESILRLEEIRLMQRQLELKQQLIDMLKTQNDKGIIHDELLNEFRKFFKLYNSFESKQAADTAVLAMRNDDEYSDLQFSDMIIYIFFIVLIVISFVCYDDDKFSFNIQSGLFNLFKSTCEWIILSEVYDRKYINKISMSIVSLYYGMFPSTVKRKKN